MASDSKPRKVKKFVVGVNNVVSDPAVSEMVIALTNDLDSEFLFKKICLYLTDEFL